MIFERSSFRESLIREEKSAVTIDKYLRDVSAFTAFAGERPLGKQLVHDWKQSLLDRGYAIRSVNSMLASVNAYLRHVGRGDCRVRNLRLQRQIYTPEERELTKRNYERLLTAAREKPRLK